MISLVMMNVDPLVFHLMGTDPVYSLVAFDFVSLKIDWAHFSAAARPKHRFRLS